MTQLNRGAYYRDQLIANVAINSLGNGLIAYYAYRSRGPIPLAEIAVDIQITVAIIAFLVAWLGVAAARKKLVAAGAGPSASTALPGLRLPAAASPGLRLPGLRLPAGAALRALVIMLGLMLVYGGLGLTGPLALLSPAGLSNWSYVAFKTIYTGGCGACAALLAIWSVFREYRA